MTNTSIIAFAVTAAALPALTAGVAHASALFDFEGTTIVPSADSVYEGPPWEWIYVYESWDESGSFDLFTDGPLQRSINGIDIYGFASSSGSLFANAQPDEDEGFSMSLDIYAYAGVSTPDLMADLRTISSIDFSITRQQDLYIAATITNKKYPDSGRSGYWTINLIDGAGATLFQANKVTADPSILQLDESIHLFAGDYSLVITAGSDGRYESTSSINFECDILLTPAPASLLAFVPFALRRRER